MRLRHWLLGAAFVLLLSVDGYESERNANTWKRALPLMQHEMWHGMGGLTH